VEDDLSDFRGGTGDTGGSVRRTGRRGALRAAAAGIALAASCASPPPADVAAPCPASGARTAEPVGFAVRGDAARGARLFLDRCEGCHASDPARRLPDAPADAARLDCAPWLAEVGPDYLYHAINRGPGLFGHGTEPPLGEQLAPMDVADLVAYLRSLDAN